MTSPELTAEKVKELRTARGWTQEELAAIAGLSAHSVISNIERGLRPGAEVERRLREVLLPAQDTVPAMTREAVASDA
jgi:transcriptional regulator with XRE-family HTH domain